MNRNSFEKELKNTFISESREMLDESETIFMEFEKDPQTLFKIDKVLRIIHTIKGSAGVIGINAIVNFSHIFENLLVEIKNYKIPLNNEISDILLSGNDILKKIIHNLDVDPLESNCTLNISNLKTVEDSIQKLVKMDKHIQTEKIHLNEDVPKIKGNILVVDDEDDILDIMRTMIKKDNFNIYTCNNGHEALEILKNNLIDVIFTDLKMPKLDGYKFTKEIRAINKFIPIVLVSGHLDLQGAKKFLTLGVSDFIEKPFTNSDLLFALDRALKTKLVWKELISISKSCFKTFVYVQKMDSILNSLTGDSEYINDRDILKKCLFEIKETTMKLLEFEKDNQV